MRTLENIKLLYKSDPCFYYPTKEEINNYQISDELLKEWISEKLIDYRNSLILQINNFEHDVELNNSLGKFFIKNIYECFCLCLDNYKAQDYYYNDILLILKKMYENDMFDYLSYDTKEKKYPFAYLVKNENPNDYEINTAWEKNQKYGGILIQIYYNCPKKFEELLFYFKDVIYQKYGIYLQESMNVLIDFCKYNNLPYVNELKESHTKAMKLNYPLHNNFKYQFVERKKIEWK